MTNNKITVCTATLGDSERRLRVLTHELRAFTRLPFRHIVCDDGTLPDEDKQRQICACGDGAAEWMEHPEPFGISYAWNALLDRVETPWAYCVEDGLRPSMGWLEAAVDVVERIGDRTWNGRKVGMAGFCHLQDWMLQMGNIWHGCSVMQVFHGFNDFWLNDWNDGYWCWNRLLPDMIKLAFSGESNGWESDVAIFKQLMLGCTPVNPHTGEVMHPMDQEQAMLKWRHEDHWPARRQAWVGWYPGAFMLVNMDAWRKVGKFCDGCSFFEGHLGVRMGMNGYLSMCVEGPPWLHCPSLGFRVSGNMMTPRDHRDTTKLFQEDFQGWNHMDAPNVLATGVVSMDEQKAINAEAAKVSLAMDDGWRKWL